jgi:gliding motility-associated-like protein
VKVLRSAAAAIILICSCLSVYAQSGTSQGTEFWTAFMDHSNIPGTKEGAVMDLYITSNTNTSGTVAVNDGSFSENFTVTANQVTILTMPASAFLGAQGLYNKGIHILAAKPIAIYAHIFADDASGATLLLPVNSLGKDYYSINYTQTSNETAYSTFIVIATQDSTTVQITPTTALLGGQKAGSPFNVTLNKGQLYQGLANNDLTGTSIQSISSGVNSCKKIAVFSGSSRIAIDCNPALNSSDNLFQQVYPTASWGKDYITVPLANRDYDIFRIVLSTPNTNVTLNGQVIPAAQFYGGDYYQFNSTSPNIISADQPIQVVQYAVSQGNTENCGDDLDDIGDPEMIFLTPLEQTLNKVTLFSTSNYAILASYINVLIKTASAPSFILDGKSYTNFTTVPGNSLYSYAQISVSRGTHTISAADGFNAIAYGFGQHESYGYAAGANLQDLNEFISLNNPQTNVEQLNGCSTNIYNLQLTLPYKTTNIQWSFSDGTPTYTDNNPRVDSIQKNGQTLYIYNYPNNPITRKAGDYTVIATVFDPNSNICGSTDAVEFDFTISDPPVAKFAVGDACFGDSTAFTDETIANAAISSWAWDFGDGAKSTLQNPLHKYKSAGDYSVNLVVTDADSCTSVYNLTKLHINAPPVAAFTVSSPDCIGENITFTSQPSATDTIAKWIWSFGDGATNTVTSASAPVNHTYVNSGVDTVKLVVITNNGCISAITAQPVTINPLPVANFLQPDVCLADAYAQFTDDSFIADSATAVITYLWNFGDTNDDPYNPNTSTLRNPRHKYAQEGKYTVSLTVQANGCPSTKTQQITVNGDNPVADFTVENSSSLCSSDSVVFDDNSTVDFCNNNRLVLFFDYKNNTQDSVVYTLGNMPADKKYRYYYGLLTNGQTANYAVKMIAYSGQSCYSEYGPVTITIKPNPVITLSQIGSICAAAAPVQIIENKDGYTGTGVFSGPGVSSTGLFNPATAGAGTFAINYVFTAQNGCGYSTSEQVTVLPAPGLSGDTVITELEGGRQTINLTATGTGLTYKWTPSAGLNHDNILNPVVSDDDDTQYTLTVTAPDGCTATANVLVKVLKNIVVPNTFTPNGDGINDVWNIKYLENYPNCTVEIFNRYGEKLYSSVGYSVPWDGTYKGAQLPTGTYYYIINPKNGRKPVSGYVAIIR